MDQFVFAKSPAPLSLVEGDEADQLNLEIATGAEGIWGNGNVGLVIDSNAIWGNGNVGVWGNGNVGLTSIEGEVGTAENLQSVDGGNDFLL